MAVREGRIAGFDGMRAIAVLMVFCGHRLPNGDALFLGGFGVRIFFVLSGFLIVGLLHRDQIAISRGERSPLEALKRFMVRRIARIFPLYYAALGALLLASLVVDLPQIAGPRMAVYALFLTNIYVEQTHQWHEPVTHIWSLAIEEQFYLLAAPAILMLPPRWTRTACMGATVMSFLWVLWLTITGDPLGTYLGSFANFGLIAMGGAIALRPGRSSLTLSAIMQPMLLAGLFLIPLCGHQLVINPVMRQLAYPLLAALLLAEIRDHQGTWVVQLLEARPLVGIGTVSYGLYLLHPLLTIELVRYVSGGLLDLPHWGRFAQSAVLLPLSLLAAYASWMLLEQPIIRFARRAHFNHPLREAKLLAS